MKKYAACVLIERNGKILTVSRKDNPNDIGLPGGKIDDGETVSNGAIRECFEETGYTVKINTNMGTFVKADENFLVRTFYANIDDSVKRVNVDESETGLVQWSEPTALLNGTFKDYNIDALMKFGILKKYVIYYTAPSFICCDDVDDIVYSTTKIEAIKEFIRRTKGSYYVVECKEAIKDVTNES